MHRIGATEVSDANIEKHSHCFSYLSKAPNSIHKILFPFELTIKDRSTVNFKIHFDVVLR